MAKKRAKLDAIQRPVPTREFWHPQGEWKCVCNTPTHKRGQRFTQPQCQYCERVSPNKETT